MTPNIVKNFDNLKPFETRFDGTYIYDAEKKIRLYSGRGIIFDEDIFYSVNFVREKLDDTKYSDEPTNISGVLECRGVKYVLQSIFFDRGADEFLFVYVKDDDIIQLDCKKTDFKFVCEFFEK